MLPLLMVAGLFLWGGVALAGLVMIVLALMVVGADSWANRPRENPTPRYRDDY